MTPSLLPESHYDLLRDAIFDNSCDRFEELLKSDGVDVDHFDAGGQTLLHLASFWGRIAIVKLLLNAGASLKVKNSAGCTALDLAIHWGHSSAAELIRLRGGRSVWEEKMGQLQIRVEDLKLQNAQVTQQWQDKRHQYDELLDEFHALHKKHEEEKGSHLETQQCLAQTHHERDKLIKENQELQAKLAEMTELYRTTAVEKTRSDCLNRDAQRQLQAALSHRDDVLAAMAQSVCKQEQLTTQWQQAETAAAIADSNRNFALADKEKLHKQHIATLSELVLTTERLHAAESELMLLRVELGEYIYGKEKDSRVLQRAARVLERREGITSTTSTASSLSPQDDFTRRPQTTPLAFSSSEPLGPVLTAKKKAQFSNAAREFGAKLRQKELKKAHARHRQHQAVENQYLTQGLSTSVAPAELFQHEFVSSLNAFATTRHEKWLQLQQDRNRQSAFAANVVARRAIATAPLPHRDRDRERRDHQHVGASHLTKAEDLASRLPMVEEKERTSSTAPLAARRKDSLSRGDSTDNIHHHTMASHSIES